MYSVKVEKDSIPYDGGPRLTSFVITLPRVVLAEIVTHRLNSETWTDEVSLCERTADRDISKNSASSRAIPFERMVAKVMDDPYMPMWTLQQKGMQGAAMSDETMMKLANVRWLAARDSMIEFARFLHDIYKIHKQDCNRLLEPWQWVTQIVTSSNWDNFFALRCHYKAFPPFRKLARMMFLSLRESTPKVLKFGEWHLPFVDESLEWLPYKSNGIDHIPQQIRFSAARCAWISYENHEKDGTPEAMSRTFDSLFKEIPIHGSPVEHQATPCDVPYHGRWSGNLTGWIQARKLIEGEKTERYLPTEDEVKAWEDV